MRDTRLQYFLTLGMLGTVLPYASVFFRNAGLNNREVGLAFAIYGLAAVVSPALVTMLADRFGDARRWLAGVNFLAGAALLLLSFADGVTSVFVTWICFCLATVPIWPVLNGIHFGHQQRNARLGKAITPFHKIRAWGTVGFVFVSFAWFPFLGKGTSLRCVLLSGAAMAALATVQALLLRPPIEKSIDRDSAPASRMPGVRAAKALFSPQLIAFTCAIIATGMASQIQVAYYPVYLTERIGMDKRWLGQASNVAVALEAVMIFGCGRLVARFGVKRLLILCILATALRMGLLAATSNIFIAIGTQVAHGCLILAIGVLPQTLFNDHAEEHFRHSMQGVLVMLLSSGQCIASFLAGYVAACSLSATYACAAGLCVVAAGLVLYGFHEKTQPTTKVELEDEVIPVVEVV